MLLAILLFPLGLLILIKGSIWLVDGASSISLKLKIAPLVIGLTVVAFGSSSPELVVSLISVLRGSTDIALGNVIGSNIFNILLVLGTASIVRPIAISGQNLQDIFMLFAATLLLFVFLFIFKRHTIIRAEGVVMLTLFVFYMVFLVYRG